ncbi:hypothetical protein SARC_12732 [Sphaeroforma arctica JP610]|uniref:CCHC-type domain-containing protein n=1 Tax=Sphaeroforma arctica JP610 TaxID=667725 RepID=A0A0L0FE39_9EUKA|nr:hypothetical protein SARC_12732 [Sphaeroforma arctica JP610]KNC74731.1 hypothetical protein SARC_12732 [Sphaeroforma arctica JP610]|eukprot:XP_014148633.1 hypothetical protein SARC_12732 [Sphaeroforma arctica JP610]
MQPQNSTDRQMRRRRRQFGAPVRCHVCNNLGHKWVDCPTDGLYSSYADPVLSTFDRTRSPTSPASAYTQSTQCVVPNSQSTWLAANAQNQSQQSKFTYQHQQQGGELNTQSNSDTSSVNADDGTPKKRKHRAGVRNRKLKDLPDDWRDRCFRCHSLDHRAVSCPTRQKNKNLDTNTPVESSTAVEPTTEVEPGTPVSATINPIATVQCKTAVKSSTPDESASAVPPSTPVKSKFGSSVESSTTLECGTAVPPSSSVLTSKAAQTSTSVKVESGTVKPSTPTHPSSAKQDTPYFDARLSSPIAFKQKVLSLFSDLPAHERSQVIATLISELPIATRSRMISYLVRDLPYEARQHLINNLLVPQMDDYLSPMSSCLSEEMDYSEFYDEGIETREPFCYKGPEIIAQPHNKRMGVPTPYHSSTPMRSAPVYSRAISLTTYNNYHVPPAAFPQTFVSHQKSSLVPDTKTRDRASRYAAIFAKSEGCA